MNHDDAQTIEMETSSSFGLNPVNDREYDCKIMIGVCTKTKNLLCIFLFTDI